MPSFEPGPETLAGVASTFVVCLWDRAEEGDARATILPNVEVIRFGFTKGSIIPSAQFRYVADSTNPESPFPYLWEQLWGLDVSGAYVVQNDDELVVYEFLSDGSSLLVFDGFASIPQVDQSGGLDATFAAEGVHKRLWDEPISGATYRDADDPEAGDEVETQLPVWFNPARLGHGQPNCTPDNFDVNEGEIDSQGEDISYPVFLDERIVSPEGTDPPVPAFWTLGGYVRHLCQMYNQAKDGNGKLWVRNPVSPSGVTIDDYLQAPVIKPGAQFMDLNDPSTFDSKPIVIRSFDASGKALVPALEEQLGYYGFNLCLNTRDDPDDPGAPLNEMILYRDDGLDGNAPKELFYPLQGATLDEGLPDFQGTGISRDAFGAVNAFDVETKPVGREVSLVLEAGFALDLADASNIKQFDHAALTNATNEMRKKYREFVFDEAGLGHWDFETSAFVTKQPTSLDAVFGAPKDDGEGNSIRQYVTRTRVGDGPLYSLDDAGKPRAVLLEISRDYEGESPGVWDRSGTWQAIGTSGWNPLKDRLGVALVCDNPENWKLPKTDAAATAGSVVKVITSLANPDTGSSAINTRFWLKYTCVIYGDRGLDVTAEKRDASPMEFTVRRIINARDHWIKQVVDASSVYNTSGKDQTIRDDTDKAAAHVNALQLAQEFPEIGGDVTIPWIEHGFGIGDQISRIDGRDIELLANAGTPSVETPRYPSVVALEYHCQGRQSTTIKLSDRRSEPENANHGYGRSR